MAVARLFFDNVRHLQGSWLTTGKDIGQLTLHFGADDLGSVMLEENVVTSAGAKHRSNRTELIHLMRSAGRIPAQRDTLYNHLVVHDDPAWTEDLVRRLTGKHEAYREHPWSPDDAPRAFIEGQLRAIVGVELVISRIEAKATLSQNRPAAVYE